MLLQSMMKGQRHLLFFFLFNLNSTMSIACEHICIFTECCCCFPRSFAPFNVLFPSFTFSAFSQVLLCSAFFHYTPRPPALNALIEHCVDVCVWPVVCDRDHTITLTFILPTEIFKDLIRLVISLSHKCTHSPFFYDFGHRFNATDLIILTQYYCFLCQFLEPFQNMNVLVSWSLRF